MYSSSQNKVYIHPVCNNRATVIRFHFMPFISCIRRLLTQLHVECSTDDRYHFMIIKNTCSPAAVSQPPFFLCHSPATVSQPPLSLHHVQILWHSNYYARELATVADLSLTLGLN